MSRAQVDELLTHGIHRFLADGVHYRDLIDVQAATADWSQWCDVWSRFAADAEARAEAALAQGSRVTAAGELARAALYYHYAQYLLYADPGAKKAAHERKVAVFQQAAPLLDPPLEHVEIPFESITLPAYLRVPRGRRKPPCVVLLGGLDTTKEDYQSINDLCVRRGLATLAFDGPGQGETFYRMPWRRDFERAVQAVLDWLAPRPEIDGGRLGIIGRSTGGFYAPKVASVDGRVKAAVAWGAMYDIRNLATMPALTRDGFLFVSGSASVEEALAFYECIDFTGAGARIRCPLLVVHGGLDAITPMDNATRMLAEVAGPTETLIWPDSGHCCHDRSHIVRPAMADFMARHLGAARPARRGR